MPFPSNKMSVKLSTEGKDSGPLGECAAQPLSTTQGIAQVEVELGGHRYTIHEDWATEDGIQLWSPDLPYVIVIRHEEKGAQPTIVFEPA